MKGIDDWLVERINSHTTISIPWLTIINCGIQLCDSYMAHPICKIITQQRFQRYSTSEQFLFFAQWATKLASVDSPMIICYQPMTTHSIRSPINYGKCMCNVRLCSRFISDCFRFILNGLQIRSIKHTDTQYVWEGTVFVVLPHRPHMQKFQLLSNGFLSASLPYLLHCSMACPFAPCSNIFIV